MTHSAPAPTLTTATPYNDEVEELRHLGGIPRWMLSVSDLVDDGVPGLFSCRPAPSGLLMPLCNLCNGRMAINIRFLPRCFKTTSKFPNSNSGPRHAFPDKHTKGHGYEIKLVSTTHHVFAVVSAAQPLGTWPGTLMLCISPRSTQSFCSFGGPKSGCAACALRAPPLVRYYLFSLPVSRTWSELESEPSPDGEPRWPRCLFL